MINQRLQLIAANDTLTNFKGWAKAVSDWFAACGWTKTADTGQVDWTSIAAVPSSSSVYEVWQPNDGGTPFYVKVEYGYSTTNYEIWLTIGTGTNGAGTIIGYVAPRAKVWGNNGNGQNNQSNVTPYECIFSGDSGRIAVMFFRDAPNVWAQGCFAIERILDKDGNSTNLGVSVWCIGTSDQNNDNTCRQRTLLFGVGFEDLTDGTVNEAGGKICTVGMSYNNAISATTGTLGGFSPVFPFMVVAGKLWPPTTLLMWGFFYDWAEGISYAIHDAYGVTRTYVAAGQYSQVFQNDMVSNVKTKLLMRIN